MTVTFGGDPGLTASLCCCPCLMRALAAASSRFNKRQTSLGVQGHKKQRATVEPTAQALQICRAKAASGQLVDGPSEPLLKHKLDKCKGAHTSTDGSKTWRVAPVAPVSVHDSSPDLGVDARDSGDAAALDRSAFEFDFFIVP